jgi:hypothetical protein
MVVDIVVDSGKVRGQELEYLALVHSGIAKAIA